MSTYTYYGSSWPTGSACPGCTLPLQLSSGSRWKDGYILANFVVNVVCLAAVFGCAVATCLTLRKPRIGRGIYLAALFFTIVNFALTILRIGLAEDNRRVTYAYYIIFVFLAFTFYMSITLTVLALGAIAQLGRLTTLALGGLLGVLTVAITGIQIRWGVYQVNVRYLSSNYALANYINNLSYALLALDVVFDVFVLLGVFYLIALFVRRRWVAALGVVGSLALIAQMALGLAVSAIYIRILRGVYPFEDDSFVQALQYTDVAPIIQTVLQAITLVLILIAGTKVQPGLDQYGAKDQGIAQVY